MNMVYSKGFVPKLEFLTGSGWGFKPRNPPLEEYGYFLEQKV